MNRTWRRIGIEQAGMVLLTVLSLLALMYFLGPPSKTPLEQVRRDPAEFAGAFAVGWLVLNIVWFVRCRIESNPGPRTPLARATFWFGVVSVLTLFTGFLLGWIALLLAPSGVVTGIVVFVKELRTRSGHNGGNIVGFLLCVSALVFLAA